MEEIDIKTINEFKIKVEKLLKNYQGIKVLIYTDDTKLSDLFKR